MLTLQSDSLSSMHAKLHFVAANNTDH